MVLFLLAARDDLGALPVSAFFLSDYVLAHVVLVWAVFVEHVLRWRLIHEPLLFSIGRILLVIWKLSPIDVGIILELSIRIRVIPILYKVLALFVSVQRLFTVLHSLREVVSVGLSEIAGNLSAAGELLFWWIFDLAAVDTIAIHLLFLHHSDLLHVVVSFKYFMPI